MYKVLLPVFLLLASLSSQTLKAQQTDAKLSLTAWIDQEIEATMQANNIPSVSVGIITGGKAQILRGYGQLNRQQKTNSDEHTVYQIASVSKMFTGTLSHQLLKEGALDLDEKITHYLPSTLSESTKAKLGEITLRELIHHRSGLPRDSKVVKRVDGEPFLGGYTEEQLLEDLELLNLEAEPGERYSYSNLGYGLLGYILERASGESYDNLLQEYITEPLKMENTAAAVTKKKFLATPYRKDARNTETKAWESGKLTPAGGLYSTVEDLTKLMNRQIQDYQEYEKSGAASPFILTKYKAPRNSASQFYGFGLNEIIIEGRGKIYGHQGDMDGFASSYLFFPKHRLGVVLLTSSGGDWLGQLSSKLLKKLEEEAKTKS